jgi:hypothetical protein
VNDFVRTRPQAHCPRRPGQAPHAKVATLAALDWRKARDATPWLPRSYRHSPDDSLIVAETLLNIGGYALRRPVH